MAGSGRFSGTCEVCDIEVWHTDTERTFLYVACCFPHLDEARRRSDAWFCEKACAQRARRLGRRVGLDELAPDRQRRSGPVAAYIPEDE